MVTSLRAITHQMPLLKVLVPAVVAVLVYGALRTRGRDELARAASEMGSGRFGV